jgi:hypothetical protein
VKDEDADWMVYHLIATETATTLDALVERCGLDAETVGASLARLERYLLIERAGPGIRALTFGESLIRNQLRYCNDLPFVIENGLIKEKKPHGR